MKDFNKVFDELNKINEDRALDKLKANMHRTHRKDYEAFVVGSLIRKAHQLSLNYNTQEFIRLQDGKVYLIDIYFPQIDLAVECDESHHLQQVEDDTVRELGISAVNGADFIRINAHDSYSTLLMQLEAVEKEMEDRKALHKGTKVQDYDYNTQVQNEKRIEQKVAMANLKNKLQSMNATSLFNNQPLKPGKYADAISILYDSFPFKNISLVHYPQKIVVCIEYDAQFDTIIKTNLKDFDNIKNVATAHFAKNPNILRLDIISFDNVDKTIEAAVKVAVEAKEKFLELIK